MDPSLFFTVFKVIELSTLSLQPVVRGLSESLEASERPLPGRSGRARVDRPLQSFFGFFDQKVLVVDVVPKVGKFLSRALRFVGSKLKYAVERKAKFLATHIGILISDGSISWRIDVVRCMRANCRPNWCRSRKIG